MKKFIIEVLALILLFLITAGMIYRIDKPKEIRKLERIDSEIEIINLGTSHGYSFDYSQCSLQGMNFYIPANTLYYDLQNYRFLKNKGLLAENAIVILPVSYFVFGLDENRTDRKKDDSFVNQFYYYLPPRYIHSYSLGKDVSLDLHKIQQNFYSFFDEKGSNNKMVKKPNKKEKDLDEITRELEKHASSRVKHHKRLSNYSAEEKNIEYLETLIREIQEAGHYAVLVTTPYYNLYNENFGLDWLQENYFTKMNRLSSKYNIPYFNYSDDERFTYDPELFANSDHLNAKGRALFSKVFFEDISYIIEKAESP